MTFPEQDRTDVGGETHLDGARGPRVVLELWRQAAITRSAEALARLYAPDAVHEFPFTRPGLPSRLEGRDEIMAWTTTIWRSAPFAYTRYDTLAVHETADPSTIIVEQEAHGSGPSTGEFALPNLLVLTVRDGLISRLRDYVNVAAAEAVLRDARLD